MFNSTDILTRLQNGETPERIASEMSRALNDAIEVYERVDPDLETAAAALNAYVAKTHPELAGDLDITPDVLEELISTLAPIVALTKAITEDFAAALMPSATTGGPVCLHQVDEDAAIKAFLTKFAQ